MGGCGLTPLGTSGQGFHVHIQASKVTLGSEVLSGLNVLPFPLGCLLFLS
jgi:hypothetical protein